MKNAFACVKGEEIVARAFISRRVNGGLTEKNIQTRKELEKYGKKVRAPFIVTLLFFLLSTVLISVCCGLIEETENFGDFYARYKVLFFCAVASIVLVVVLFAATFFYCRKIAASFPFVDSVRKAENVRKDCMRELNVPENAALTDVLTYELKRKNGIEKRKSFSHNYENSQVNIFKEDDRLCFFCDTYVLSVPVSSIRQIVYIKKRTNIAFWNKETPYNKGEYRQFKIRSKDGGYQLRGYYSLQFFGGNEEFEILIPEYDAKTVFTLTGGRFGSM